MVAGVLNVSQSFYLHPLATCHKPPRRRPASIISIRATSSETPSSSSSATSEDKIETTFAPPPTFKPPEPQPFAVNSGKTSEILSASLGLILRLGAGTFVSGYSVSFVSKDEIPSDQYALTFAGYKVKETSKVGPRPEKPIEIYEFQGCPFCRKVREIVAVLDIDVLFYPCPKDGPTFRPKAIQMGGKAQFPYMMDPNTGTSMYESDDIIKYLVEKYGDGSVPLTLSLGPLTTLSAGFAALLRAGKGSTYTPSKMPPKPLEIWAYEGSPFCTLVRETLVELELPHIQHSCARGSSKRQPFYEKVGHFQVPYLEDPNTGVKMFESADIVDYLRATYALQ